MTWFDLHSHLGVDSNDLAAILAGVGEHRLVALDAVRVVILEDVALAGQAVIALPAAEVARMPVFGHRLRVFSTEN